jgi:hypothetical protein
MIAKTLKLFVTLKAGMGILSFIGDRNVDNLLEGCFGNKPSPTANILKLYLTKRINQTFDRCRVSFI